jgi:hypothetical protein
VLAATAGSSPYWAPSLLSRLEWFEVRHVEVAGNRYLAPHEVLLASGVARGQSVWEETAAREAALRAHPGIDEARVSRRLPATLRIRIREKRPVAYVLERSLVPATAAGEVLPLDPRDAALDLPIVHGPWPDTLPTGSTRLLLAEVGRLGEIDPGLLSEVSEVRARDGQPAVLVLQHRLAEILLPGGASPDRLAELRAVLAELERRGATGPQPGSTLVDARFEAQIVVRQQSSV